MQKFKAKFQNSPTDAPQVCSSENSVLNREETLSVQDKVLALNNLYKDATFVSIIRWKFRKFFSDCRLTYGNETYVNRIALRLEKTHYNDAFVIAGGINQVKTLPVCLKQKHINNRVLQLNRKGFKPAIRRKRYSIQPYDIVFVSNKKYIAKGCCSYGRSVLCTNGANSFNFGIKKIEKVLHTKSIFN